MVKVKNIYGIATRPTLYNATPLTHLYWTHTLSSQYFSHALAPYLLLWRTPEIGPTSFLKLVQRFADIRWLFKAKTSELLASGIPEKLALSLQTPDWKGMEQDLRWAEKPRHHILLWNDPQYPSLLQEIAHKPPILWVNGDLSVLHTAQIAIVGSRKPTPAGIENTKLFTQQLCSAGLTITSGLALGIDACSHQSALKHGGKTIAVLGTGIDRIYPTQHQKLAESIIACGALVSEFPLGVPPMPKHFPRRNRIVSGLSAGTLVVEAALKSGSLITANLANEQGREVFAIPGSIHNSQTKGCHALIQQGAKLVQDPQEILEELHFRDTSTKNHHNPEGSRNCKLPQNSLDADHQVLLECINSDKTSVDELTQRTGFSADKISFMALQLELRGLITAMPGGYFKI